MAPVSRSLSIELVFYLVLSSSFLSFTLSFQVRLPSVAWQRHNSVLKAFRWSTLHLCLCTSTFRSYIHTPEDDRAIRVPLSVLIFHTLCFCVQTTTYC